MKRIFGEAGLRPVQPGRDGLAQFAHEVRVLSVPEVGGQGTPVRRNQQAGERYYLRVCCCGDGWVTPTHRPAGAVEDPYPAAEFFVVLPELAPLSADVVRKSKSDHRLVPPEAADQTQVLFVASQDVGLATQAWLRAVIRADPPSVVQANDLLRILPAPDCLLGAADKGAHLAGRAVDPWVDWDIPEIKRSGPIAVDLQAVALARARSADSPPRPI